MVVREYTLVVPYISMKMENYIQVRTQWEKEFADVAEKISALMIAARSCAEVAAMVIAVLTTTRDAKGTQITTHSW